MNTEVIEGEVVSRELVPHEAQVPSLYGTNEPTEIVAKATATANALKDVINKQGLITNIQGKEYVQVGGWTLLGSMMGVFPVNVWTREVEGGWEARVEARTLSGAIVGAAEAQCCRDEKMWASRDSYALRSMAQTRATSKALRMPLGFVVTLAGFEATPAEEMTFERDEPREAKYRPKTAFQPNPKEPAGRKPICPEHGLMVLRPAGTSKKTGKEYGAFWTCQERECKAGDNGRGFTIFADVWQQMVDAEGRDGEPRVTIEEADAIPAE